MNKLITLCAIDIETSGPNLIKNGILSIGVCAGSIQGNIIIKKRFDIKLDQNQEYDKDTYEQFWSKNLEVLYEINKSPMNPLDGITEFIKLIDNLDEKYKLIIISDCVSFDIGFINYYLAKYLNRKPLTYDYKGVFRPIYDTDSFSRGVVGASYNKIYTDDNRIMKKLNFTVKKNSLSHMPDNDAEYIYNMHRSVLIKNTKK
jgi:hypothetical protein